MLPTYNSKEVITWGVLKKLCKKYSVVKCTHRFFSPVCINELTKNGGFEEYNLRGYIGLYFMLSDQDKILYVGRTTNCFKNRVGCYVRGYMNSSEMIILFPYVWRIGFLAMADKDEIISLEKELIRYLRPPMNKSGLAWSDNLRGVWKDIVYESQILK